MVILILLIVKHGILKILSQFWVELHVMVLTMHLLITKELATKILLRHEEIFMQCIFGLSWNVWGNIYSTFEKVFSLCNIFGLFIFQKSLDILRSWNRSLHLL